MINYIIYIINLMDINSFIIVLIIILSILIIIDMDHIFYECKLIKLMNYPKSHQCYSNRFYCIFLSLCLQILSVLQILIIIIIIITQYNIIIIRLTDEQVNRN